MEEAPIPKELIDILVCPVCKGELEYNIEKTRLSCKKCKHEYKIQDGIPVLIAPEGKEKAN